MKRCEQVPGYSVYQHGLDVANRYRDLYDHLLGATPCYRWSIKNDSFLQLQGLVNLALSAPQVRLYHIFHDCSKPTVLFVDEHGRRHFPDHANASAKIFSEITENEPCFSDIIELIKLDIGFHAFRGDQLIELCSHKLAPTLLLTAWAELHANAEMLFGGFDSTSFKIKRKALSKAAKQLFENTKADSLCYNQTRK